MIGHHQEAIVVDLESLPVLSSMSLQSLITDETAPPLVPPIDDGQLRLHFPQVCHHQESLTDNTANHLFENIYPYVFNQETFKHLQDCLGSRATNSHLTKKCCINIKILF